MRRPPRAIVIGGSTGAPAAMSELLAGLMQARIDAPIFVAIHVPGAFSGSLASAFARASGRPCELVTTKIAPLPGVVYAPGPDAHLRLASFERRITVEAVKGLRSAYTPSVDHLFETAAATYGRDLLAIVLTGIGADGLQGAQSVAQAGGTVLAQSPSSSVAAPMPSAVLKAGLATEAGGPGILAARIAHMFKGDVRER